MLETCLLVLVLIVNGFLFVVWKNSYWLDVLVKIALLTIVILDVIILYKNFGGN